MVALFIIYSTELGTGYFTPVHATPSLALIHLSLRFPLELKINYFSDVLHKLEIY